MKSERRKHYPRKWEQLARQCKEQAGWRCKHCHITQGKTRISKRTGNRYVVFLHAAHRDHDIGNSNPILFCLCPTCHGKFDYRHRKRQQLINQERLKHKMLLTLRS